MNEWKECKLEDVADIFTGFPFKGDQYESDGNLRVIRGENVTVGSLRWDTTKFWNKKYDEKYLLNTTDIVIGMDGSKVGQNRSLIKKQDLPLILAQRVARIRSKKDSDQRFLWYTIFNNDFVEYVSAIHTGTSIPHISLKQIADFDILLPPIEDQKVIAEILSSLDDKIDLLNRQSFTIEELAKTLFRQWFIEENNESWETVRIGDLVTTNTTSITKKDNFNTISYLDTGSLNEGKINELQRLNFTEAPSRARRIVKHNDILISTVRPNQKHYGIIKYPASDLIVSTGFCVISCKKIDPHFIYMHLTMGDMTEYLHSIAEGSTSTYPSLKPSDIEDIEIQLPPEQKLNAFSEYANDAWEKIHSNHTQIKTLEKLRDTLLPKLLSGEVKVQNV